VLFGAWSVGGGDGGSVAPAGTRAGGGSSGAGAGAGAGGDAGTGNLAGSGGTAGQGGTAGTAGSAGAAGTAGTAGNAGSAGAAGTGGSDPDAGDAGVVDGDSGVGDGGLGDAAVAPPCTGCLELRTAAFDASGDSTFFQLNMTSTDLSGVVATFHAQTLTPDDSGQLYVEAFANDSTYAYGAGTHLALTSANFAGTSFIDLVVDIDALDTAGNIDGTDVISLGVQVGAGGGFTGTAAPVLLLDSITFTGANAPTDMEFTDDAQDFVVNIYTGVFAGAEVIHH
jgi:hypothetical protein